jgi:hypothetical protein
MREHPSTNRHGNCGATLGGPYLSRHTLLPDCCTGTRPKNEMTSEFRATSLLTADDLRTPPIKYLTEQFTLTRSPT